MLLQLAKNGFSVSQNLTLTMRWADGVTETYVHQGDGVFTDKRGGIGRPYECSRWNLFKAQEWQSNRLCGKPLSA